MAQGTVQFFEEAVLAITDGTINLDTDTFNIALFTSSRTFAPADAAPEYSTTNECLGGNGYTQGGESISATYDEVGGTTTFAVGTDVVWTQNGSGPVDIYWGLIYSTNAAAGIDSIAYVDMGNAADISLQDGNITVSAGTVVQLVL